MSAISLSPLSTSWSPSGNSTQASVTASAQASSRVPIASAVSPDVTRNSVTNFTPSAIPEAVPSTMGDTRFLHVTQWPSAMESIDVTYEAIAPSQTSSRQMQVWEQTPTTAVDQIIGRNASATTEKARFAGLGSALIEQAARTGSSYRQTVVNLGAVSSPEKIQGKATGAMWGIQSSPSASATFAITTQSGVTVRISIADQREQRATGSGIAVQIEVDGNLTQQEKDALQSLAEGFDLAIEGLTAESPVLRLDGLLKFDSKLFTKLEFKVDIYGVDQDGVRILKLGANISADAKTREIELKSPEGTVRMKTDLRQPALWGTADQKAYAVRQYLSRIDKAAERGHADSGLVDLFKSSFAALNGGYESANSPGRSGSASISIGDPVDLTRDANAFSEGDKSLLTGLADFDASITATRRASNPRRTKEVDTFEYTLKQSTQVSGSSPSNRGFIQTQSAKLSAAYHQSLHSRAAPKLTSDSATQNYSYEKVEDSSSTQVELGYEKDEPVRALITQAASQSLHVLKVENNKITENTAEPAHVQSKQTDLLPLLKQLKRQQDANQLTDDEKQSQLQEWGGMVLGSLATD